jgi:hypothetical protein
MAGVMVRAGSKQQISVFSAPQAKSRTELEICGHGKLGPLLPSPRASSTEARRDDGIDMLYVARIQRVLLLAVVSLVYKRAIGSA